MNVKTQKRIVHSLFKVGKKRIKFNIEKLSEIKEAITKRDIKGLVSKEAIKINQKTGSSKSRSRKILTQKRKGRRKGIGSRKGKVTARLKPKKAWMGKIRIQRAFLKELKNKKLINTENYRDLYLKSKGGFFRNRRHLKTYINERGLIENGKK